MKSISSFLCLLTAILCFAQSAQAQYTDQIHRNRDGFVDRIGQSLSDAELVDLIGEDIYFDTVIGARKQYNAGRKLILGGAIGIGAGYLAASYGSYLILASQGRRVAYDDNYYGYYHQYDYTDSSPFGTVAGSLLAISGYAALISGFLALDAGIPLKIIGQSRLNWVENNYNERQAWSVQLGPTPSGVGIAVRF